MQVMLTLERSVRMTKQAVVLGRRLDSFRRGLDVIQLSFRTTSIELLMT